MVKSRVLLELAVGASGKPFQDKLWEVFRLSNGEVRQGFGSNFGDRWMGGTESYRSFNPHYAGQPPILRECPRRILPLRVIDVLTAVILGLFNFGALGVDFFA